RRGQHAAVQSGQAHGGGVVVQGEHQGAGAPGVHQQLAHGGGRGVRQGRGRLGGGGDHVDSWGAGASSLRGAPRAPRPGRRSARVPWDGQLVVPVPHREEIVHGGRPARDRGGGGGRDRGRGARRGRRHPR